MCTVASAVSLIVTAVGTASSMYERKEQTRQAEKAAEQESAYQLGLLETEKAKNMEEAQRALQRGEIEAERQRRNARRGIGDVRSMLSAGGFELDSGSNLSLLTEQAEENQYENSLIRYQAATEANRLQNQAWQTQGAQWNLQAQKKLASSAARSNLNYQQGKSLLTGMAQGGLAIYSGLQESGKIK